MRHAVINTISIILFSLISLTSHAQSNDISLEQAQMAVKAAIQRATDLDTKMDICVVDAGGNLKAFARMDGAWLGSIDIAIKKAKTARFFDLPTGEIGKLSQPGGPLYNIEHSNGGLITFPGGLPIKNKAGLIIGAIGVSGSSVVNDHLVAEAGIKAIQFE
ncbi:MAG: heme-binding protein [Pseudomonadota bacterium]|nr:heme-binding protein [Pseudomonadota bacterium]